MMSSPREILFIGNGVNNISSGKTWEQLLKSLHQQYFDQSLNFEDIKRKPFPLIYEQIVMWQLQQKNHRIEKELKKKIADDVLQMKQNKVHLAIASGHWKEIITPNYEFCLMPNRPDSLKNNGAVNEKVYSVFRHFKVSGKRYWHLHGDIQNTDSINLGYEHYCGQLQRMREYVTGAYRRGKKGKAGKFEKPLLVRDYLKEDDVHSWIDFFFKDNCTIRIMGFRLELEEIDLWWLLTYRAKIMYGAVKQFTSIPVNNHIIFYIPKKYATGLGYEDKKNLLESMSVEIKEIDIEHGEDYYLHILDQKFPS